MQTIIEQGIAFIIALQGVGGWLTIPMKLFSYLGTEDFFFLVLPLLYWSVDASLGLRVAFILAFSNPLNYVLKLAFATPRPYWVSSQVKALWSEITFGIPSGHAQLAVGVWGTIAAYFKRAWLWIAAVLVIFLIGFSRVYLGAHFPHDVIIGWLLGFMTLWAFLFFWDPASAWLEQKNLSQKIVIAFIVSMIFIVIGFGATLMRSDFQIPEQWASNALLTGTDKPDPVDPNGIFTSAGTLFGLGVGAAWMMSKGGYQASGSIPKRTLRYVIGIIGVAILWLGLGEIFPRGDGFIVYTLRYIRYALVGFWVTGGAPWVFLRLKLAEQTE